MKKLRILCLHGYHGSAQILRRQLAPLVDGMDEWTEFVCIDAPSLVEKDFGWWHAASAERGEADTGVGRGIKRYEGWHRTRHAIGSAFAQRGPFDGVLGFSQGAALSALLVGLRSGSNPAGLGTAVQNHDSPLAFGFAVMIGGFVSADPDLAGLYGERSSYDLPSMHIIGRRDTVVPPIASFALTSRFCNPLILEHEGGHFIPGSQQIRQRFRSFLKDMQR